MTHCESKHVAILNLSYIYIYIYSCDRLTFPLSCIWPTEYAWLVSGTVWRLCRRERLFVRAWNQSQTPQPSSPLDIYSTEWTIHAVVIYNQKLYDKVLWRGHSYVRNRPSVEDYIFWDITTCSLSETSRRFGRMLRNLVRDVTKTLSSTVYYHTNTNTNSVNLY
jgi:hypothetical protein